MHVELRHLRYFLAVAEELNFTRAAARLHVAQPALSAQVRALETQLGCELFRRTTRSVALTPAGEMLVGEVREILARVDAALANARAAGRGVRGLLRIGFAAHGAGEIGMEILRRFSERFPDVATELVSASSLHDLQSDLLHRATDTAFVWLPLLYEELAAEPVLEERRFVAVHPGHVLAGKPGVRVGDLLEEPLVAPWSAFPPEFLRAWFGEFRPTGRLPIDADATTVDESLAFVSRGLAVYCVPESASRFYARPDVAFRPIEDVDPVSVAVAWRDDGANPAVADFVEIVRGVVVELRAATPAI
jgi:DNA-binding transcriptional LysR family regulator